MTAERQGDWVRGDELPAIVRRVTQVDIDRYADASGGRARIHLDAEYARRAGLGGTIAHGMLTLTYVDQVLVRWLGTRWYDGGRLDVKFVAAVRPGDTVMATGRVVSPAGADTVECELWAETQDGRRVIAGRASWRGEARLVGSGLARVLR